MPASFASRKIPVDVFTVEDSYQGDGIGLNNQTQAVVSQPETVMSAFRSDFFEVLQVLDSCGCLDFVDDLLKPF
jgi:hypothetical protein